MLLTTPKPRQLRFLPPKSPWRTWRIVNLSRKWRVSRGQRRVEITPIADEYGLHNKPFRSAPTNICTSVYPYARGVMLQAVASDSTPFVVLLICGVLHRACSPQISCFFGVRSFHGWSVQGSLYKDDPHRQLRSCMAAAEAAVWEVFQAISK